LVVVCWLASVLFCLRFQSVLPRRDPNHNNTRCLRACHLPRTSQQQQQQQQASQHQSTRWISHGHLNVPTWLLCPTLRKMTLSSTPRKLRFTLHRTVSQLTSERGPQPNHDFQAPFNPFFNAWDSPAADTIRSNNFSAQQLPVGNNFSAQQLPVSNSPQAPFPINDGKCL
jgi:hypothetical protein